MKTLNTLKVLVGLLSTIGLTAQELTTLTIQIEGCKSDEGKMYVALYSDAGDWLATAKMGDISEIADGKATVTLESVPYGTYAISTYHDENLNGKLDTGLFGIPTEPYASSRGAKGRFGPPKWEDAKFTLSEPTSTEVIKY